jgi:hypothetical protein
VVLGAGAKPQAFPSGHFFAAPILDAPLRSDAIAVFHRGSLNLAPFSSLMVFDPAGKCSSKHLK